MKVSKEMDEVMQQLISDIVNHPMIKQEIFQDFEHWHRSQFRHLARLIGESISQSDLISNERKQYLGISISESTLLRFFKSRSEFAKNFDPRVTRTLDKLAVFLGFEHWKDYSKKRIYQKFDTTSINQQLKSTAHPQKDPTNAILQVVNASNEISYRLHFDMPNFDFVPLKKLFVKNSPSLNRLIKFHERLAEKGWIINSPKNATSYEILDYEVKLVDDHHAQVYTKEFWLLEYYDPKQKREFIYKNDISEQVYVLELQNNKWLVKNNFNNSIAKED
jgi:hypothetical protein